jgi:hypothetical protein
MLSGVRGTATMAARWQDFHERRNQSAPFKRDLGPLKQRCTAEPWRLEHTETFVGSVVASLPHGNRRLFTG